MIHPVSILPSKLPGKAASLAIAPIFSKLAEQLKVRASTMHAPGNARSVNYSAGIPGGARYHRLAMPPLSPIHRIILSRLAAVWIALSLLFGAAAYYIELEKIDDFVVALAGSESERFSALGIPLDTSANDGSRLILEEKAREFAREHFVVVEIYDHQRRKVAEAVNEQHQAIESAMQGFDFEAALDLIRAEAA